jgi:ferredoxin--NADP+ reductase
MTDWTQARVVGKQQWTPRLFSLQFDADLQPFKAGQFLRVGMDIGEEQVGRPYSFINAPHERPHEIYFNVVGEGQFSPHLATLEPGDTFWAKQSPLGFLTLNEIPDAQQLWLLASGTGIGPFLSILKTDEVWQRFEHVVLTHSVSHATDLTYQETISYLCRTHSDRLNYIPLVSRENAPNALRGRIPANIENGRLEQYAGHTLDPRHSHVMLCGNAGMIEATITLLSERGMRRHRRSEAGHISSEHYY